MSYIEKKQWLDSLISSEEDQEKRGNLTKEGIGYLNGLKSARKMIFGEGEIYFYLDYLSDQEFWLIKSIDGKRYTAGDDKQKVVNLINKLNLAGCKNIKQGEIHEIFVCWNNDNNYNKEI